MHKMLLKHRWQMVHEFCIHQLTWSCLQLKSPNGRRPPTLSLDCKSLQVVSSLPHVHGDFLLRLSMPTQNMKNMTNFLRTNGCCMYQGWFGLTQLRKGLEVRFWGFGTVSNVRFDEMGCGKSNNDGVGWTRKPCNVDGVNPFIWGPESWRVTLFP